MRKQHFIALAAVSLVLIAALPTYALLQPRTPPAPTRDWSRTDVVTPIVPADGAPAALELPTPSSVASSVASRKPTPLLTVQGQQLLLNGTPTFLTAVNYPGRSNQDFGTGAWGHSGVSDPTTSQEVDADFSNMAGQGVRVVKWDVFDDGRYSPTFDASGSVTGLDDTFYADLDAAVAQAQQHDMYLVLSLFSDRFWDTQQTVNGVALGGHAATLTDPGLRTSLIQNAIVPLTQHISGTDRVLAIELLNTPEFGIQELNKDQDGRTKIPLADVQAFVKDAAAAIHANTVALAAVESNRATNMPQWRGLGLDYYSYQFQDWQDPYEPLGTDVNKYALDKPALVEVPAAGSQTHPLSQALDLVKQHGYSGVMVASYLMPAGNASWADAASAFSAWAKQHWDDMNLTAHEAPSDAVALKPLPYSVNDVTFTPQGTQLVADLNVSIQQSGTYAIQLLAFAQGAKNPSTVDDRVGIFQAGDQQDIQLRVNLGDLKPGEYKLSVGFFSTDSGTWKLAKWVDQVGLLTYQDGMPQVLTGAAMQQALSETAPKG
ncbi:MAG: hypothetical protein JOZ81_26060 [Chloroflexi bacterium]|nr:hypothetical protein [Chloroflexota bacterium]